MPETTTVTQNRKANGIIQTVVAIIGVLVIIAILVWIARSEGSALDKLKIAIGYGLLLLILLWGLAILIDIFKGTIDLSGLLSEVGGGASMSRFQLLIFTFVIALSFFLIVVSTGDFPKVPPEVLTLLGISASTYAVSKGIQVGSQLPAGKHPTEVHEEQVVTTAPPAQQP